MLPPRYRVRLRLRVKRLVLLVPVFPRRVSVLSARVLIFVFVSLLLLSSFVVLRLSLVSFRRIFRNWPRYVVVVRIRRGGPPVERKGTMLTCSDKHSKALCSTKCCIAVNEAVDVGCTSTNGKAVKVS